MQRGPWHQFGNNSQKMALEMIENHEVGAGVIISPRDLSKHKAVEYAERSHNAGIGILLDQQFYVPGFSNDKLRSFETNSFRASVSELNQISDTDLDKLTTALESIHQEISATAVLAPAVIYEPGRPEIVDLNERLYSAAQNAGESLGIPTYATVVLSESSLASDQTLADVLGSATTVQPDGWYFACEFGKGRLPTNQNTVYRCGVAALQLATSGVPVLHAYAGPLGLLSFGFGCTAAGVGFTQNTWGLDRGRWEKTEGGGGGDAPPRFFSGSLWGTLVYPDEIAGLTSELAEEILTHSPYSANVTHPPVANWDNWKANQHLLFTVCSGMQEISDELNARNCASNAGSRLYNANYLYDQIEDLEIHLRPDVRDYHEPWRQVILKLLDENAKDYDFLEI